jgi:hypothetical protein
MKDFGHATEEEGGLGLYIFLLVINNVNYDILCFNINNGEPPITSSRTA